MPVNPIKMKDSLDRFYTKENIAKTCIELMIDVVGEDNLFIEPSAGGGSFFKQLPINKIGVDLSPTIDGIITQDWLTFDIPKYCVVVGNPPFGTRNSLTRAFISHSAKNAKCISFILPSSYRKETAQRAFSSEWSLVVSYDLPKNSFIYQGGEYHVPCVFQVWVLRDMYPTLEDLRESSKIPLTSDDFKFCKKQEAEFFVFGAAPSKIIKKELVLPNNRGYYINQLVDGVIENFTVIDWRSKGNSSVSGGVAWYSKQEIINIYEEHKNESTK